MILQVLVWIIIAQVIISWLFAFNVLNTGSVGLRRFVGHVVHELAELRALDRADEHHGTAPERHELGGGQVPQGIIGDEFFWSVLHFMFPSLGRTDFDAAA